MSETPGELTTAIGDRYRIERELGAGGMAHVYLARDLRHGRDVAIKVMRPELAAVLGPERFLREIRLLARLQHPHILGLVDSGEAGGRLYYVMPFLAEGSLRGRLDRERELPVEDAVRILREIAEALAHAHAEGVVHRDIKPENVLFSAGHVQVADFGVARIVGDGDAGATLTALTATGAAVGSPRYMAPEQVAGDPKTDHRADLYALGALAYEMLAGVPPFVASSAAEVMALHLGQEAEALSKRRRSVPATLEDLIMRCLRKRPADRWQTAHEVIARLDRSVFDDGGVTRGASARGTISGRLAITGALASRLDRGRFDPRMIGDSLGYFDNMADSDVLVMLLNAAWLDGSDLEPHARVFPYRCVVPTLYGFEPQARHRFALSLDDHNVLLAELLRSKVEEVRPELVIVGGFSSAGDLVMRLAARTPEGARVPDGILALGCNQALETCFVSRVLARLDRHDPARLLRDLCAVGESATTLDDWIIINGYMGRIMARFRDDLGPLLTLARDIIEPFERDDRGAFASMYRETAARVRSVRCVFEDSEPCNRLLRAVLVDHMDRGVLGPHHRDGALVIDTTPSHFELMQPERVGKHLAAMVQELRERR